ncbi:MAG: peptidoglycan editing factor PgeF [Vicinamibacterales bacterium]
MTHDSIATPIAFQFDTLRRTSIRHAMSGRRRCEPAEGDIGHSPTTNAEEIEHNRSVFLAAAGVASTDLVVSRQTHSSNVACVTANDRGRGLYPLFDGVPDTDAMVTDDPTVALGIITADCVPILLYDPHRHALGLAHAGWRGSVNSIAAETVRAMSETFGSQPSEIVAGIGPSIGPCCYEVGADVLDDWASAGVRDASRAVIKVESGYHFNLWAANRRVLIEAGVPDRQIEYSAICVRCERERFFSHRATRQLAATPGRNLMVAQLLPA